MLKLSTNLPTPVAASNDCLPHAAMTLGSIRGMTARPTSGALVSRLVIQESMGQWYLYRLDDCGGFVGDTSHPTLDDAMETAKKEFGVETSNFR